MSGLDLAVAMHCLAVEPDRRPMKQAPKRIHPDLATKVEIEVDKLVSPALFGKYNILLHIVSVKKKKVKVRVCIDFQDLNKACPINDFPIPHMELLIDAITVY